MINKLLAPNLFRILTILLFTTLINNFPALAQTKLAKAEYEVEVRQLKGYQIKFDYVKYPKEREIAYQYFLDNYKDNETFSGIKISDIGVDLYDLDSDGKLEIFAYINYGDRCPRSGCPFATLRILDKQRGEKDCRLIPWSTPSGMDMMMLEGDFLKILSTITLGFHDILFLGRDPRVTLWKWNGSYYEISKVYKQQ